MALEKLTETLESHRKMNMSEVQDFATTRALYEYAMEHYSAGAIKDASALFEVLSGLSNDHKFSSALKFLRKNDRALKCSGITLCRNPCPSLVKRTATLLWSV